MRALAASTLLLVAACSGGSGDEEEILPAALEIGSADATGEGFVAVDDGADVELVSGAQGGFHVWTTPRLSGAVGTIYLDREARRVSDDTLVLRAARTVLEVPGEAMLDWWHEDYALPSFMCPSPVGIRVFDEELSFHFELRDEDENLLAQDEIVLVPRCPTGDMNEFCQSVCGG